jgi:hypothetical protein
MKLVLNLHAVQSKTSYGFFVTQRVNKSLSMMWGGISPSRCLYNKVGFQ